MPIVKPSSSSAPVFYPDTDYVIVKYFDLTKYISLLQRQALFFCRLDKLEDKFEGRTSKVNFESRIRWHQYLRDELNFFQVPMPDEKIIELVNESFEHDKLIKSINCVNCWNKSEDESAALWKIYSDFNKGILIKSSISKLENALVDTTECIRLSEIRYLDYDNEEMLDGNTLYPLIHKQKAYSYENEVRLIHEVSQNGWIHDWSTEEIDEGIFIKTDLDTLIDEIVISPHSPSWFYKLVDNLTTKYGLNKCINKSKLTLVE